MPVRAGVYLPHRGELIRNAMQIKPHVLWPERVALAAAAIVAGATVCLWLLLTLGVGTLRDINLDRAALGWLVDAETGLVLPLWLGLRAVFVGIALVRRHRTPLNLQALRRHLPRGPRTDA